MVGGEIDSVQWAAILRSVSAHRSYRWVYKDSYKPWRIADYLILNRQMPRSLRSCYEEIVAALDDLARFYGKANRCQGLARETLEQLMEGEMTAIFQSGLHEFLLDFIARNNAVFVERRDLVVGMLNQARGLALGFTLFWAWCLALVPALCTLRRGWWNAVRFYFASIARESAWIRMLVLAVIGAALIGLIWRLSGDRWQALLTSLVGMAFGGGIVWAVRIAGRLALHKEAMGFGDVTLMAMIGAFLGWQPCLMIFFVAPFLALGVALLQAILTGRRDIPYGPYLCGAAALVILRWPWFWQRFGPLFAFGWLLPAVLAAGVVLMVALLTAWRLIERAVFR